MSKAEGVASRAKSRADHYEIFLASSRGITVSVNGGTVAADDGEVEGGGIRVALGRRLGFASASGLGVEALEGALDEALGMAKALGYEDKGFEGFAERKPLAREGSLDEGLLTITGEELVRRTGETYSAAMKADPRMVTGAVTASVDYGGYAVANSSGVQGATRFTALGATAYDMTAAAGDRRKTGSDFMVSRKLVDFVTIGPSAARNAVAMLEAKPLGRTATLTTVWEPVTAGAFLETALGNSINGRSVHEGRSAFRGKLDQEVGSKSLTIKDDGQLKEGLATAALDMEGVPQKRTTIIDRGVLRSFLFDHYFGRLEGGRSTGNARRGGTEVFASTPNIGSTTLVVGPGQGKLDALISGVDDGVLVTDSVMGLGHANVISGDFSVVATNPFLIRGGEVVGALEPLTLAGNLYRCLAQIQALGGERRLVGSILTPPMALGGVTASG